MGCWFRRWVKAVKGHRPPQGLRALINWSLVMRKVAMASCRGWGCYSKFTVYTYIVMITRTWEKTPFSVHEICSMLSYELSALFHLALQWGSTRSDRSKASLREKVGFEGTSARGNCWCYITLASIKWLQNPRNMSRNPNMLDRLVSWAKAASSTVTVFFGGLPNHLLGERRGRYWTLWRAQIPALIKLIETWNSVTFALCVPKTTFIRVAVWLNMFGHICLTF